MFIIPHSKYIDVMRKKRTINKTIIHYIKNKKSMKTIKLLLMILMSVSGIATVNAQRSERQTKNGSDDYRNRVPIEIAKIKAFSEFIPFHHLDGVEIGGRTTTLTLVDIQDQSALRGHTKAELKHNTANQGISVWVPDTSSMLYTARKYFSLHLKYKNELPFDAKSHMVAPEDSTQMSSHNAFPLTDSTAVHFVGFLVTHYPSFSEQENMVREYRTDIRTVVMEKEKSRVQTLEEQIQLIKDEIFKNKSKMISLIPALESERADRREVRKERDSLDRINHIFAQTLKKSEALQSKYKEEMDAKVEAYVKVYQKHLCEFFAFGGVIFDGIELVPENKLLPLNSTDADYMVATPITGDEIYKKADGSKLKNGQRVNFNGQDWIVQGNTCIPVGSGYNYNYNTQTGHWGPNSVWFYSSNNLNAQNSSVVPSGRNAVYNNFWRAYYTSLD